MNSSYVLDSYALLVHLEDEPGAEKVRRILRKASTGNARLFVSAINLGELYYIALREMGLEKAEEALFLVEQLPIQIAGADLAMTLKAARLKGMHPVAYADCFAAALALQENAKLLTGDPEFRKFGDTLSVEWI